LLQQKREVHRDGNGFGLNHRLAQRLADEFLQRVNGGGPLNQMEADSLGFLP
jgi:hypothetical protein